jgi:hypothetical protein
MNAGREPGKGSEQAVSRTVEIVFTVWHEGRERNGMVRVPDRIVHEQVVREIGRELELDLGSPIRWRLWKGNHPAMPPLVEGNEYGLVPADISSSISTEPLVKRDIDFTSQIRRHGPMATVIISVLGTRQTVKVPPETTLSQLIRRNMTVGTLPPETVFSWGNVTLGAPGRLQDGDIVEIKVGGNEVSRCHIYTGFGQFAEPFEMDVVARGEAELLTEENRLNPRIGTSAQYYQGTKKLASLIPAPDLLIFPKEIERSSMDSPTETGIAADPMRKVGPLKTIRWSLVTKKGIRYDHLTRCCRRTYC